MYTMKEALPNQVQLKKRSDLHLSRKFFHAGGISFILGLFYSLPRQDSLYMAAGALAIFLPIDWLRAYWRPANRLFIKVFGRYMRQNARYNLTGSTYLLVGVLVLVAFFPREIVFLSLAMLALGDPVASIIGVLYGQDKLVGNKSLQGSLAAFVVCSIISIAYYFYLNIMIERLVLVGLLSGLIGAFSELCPVGKIDDNLSFPVISALLLYALFYVFGGFV